MNKWELHFSSIDDREGWSESFSSAEAAKDFFLYQMGKMYDIGSSYAVNTYGDVTCTIVQGGTWKDLGLEQEQRMTDNYTVWMNEVNNHLVSFLGLGADDLPDALWRDYHDSELSPLEAIDCAVCDAWDDQPEMQELFDNYVGKMGVAV